MLPCFNDRKRSDFFPNHGSNASISLSVRSSGAFDMILTTLWYIKAMPVVLCPYFQDMWRDSGFIVYK